MLGGVRRGREATFPTRSSSSGRLREGWLLTTMMMMLMRILVGSLVGYKKKKMMMMMIRMTGKELRAEEEGFQQEEAQVVSHITNNFSLT